MKWFGPQVVEYQNRHLTWSVYLESSRIFDWVSDIPAGYLSGYPVLGRNLMCRPDIRPIWYPVHPWTKNSYCGGGSIGDFLIRLFTRCSRTKAKWAFRNVNRKNPSIHLFSLNLGTLFFSLFPYTIHLIFPFFPNNNITTHAERTVPL